MRTIRDEDDKDEGVVFEDARVIRCTARAAQYEFADGDRHWIPHSCIHDDSELFYDERAHGMNDREGMLVVKSWFAEKEGLV